MGVGEGLDTRVEETSVEDGVVEEGIDDDDGGMRVEDEDGGTGVEEVGVGVGVGVGLGVAEGEIVTVVVAVVVVVLVNPLVTVVVAVPDLKMLEQKSNASDVRPSNASSPHWLTSGFPDCLFPRTAASAVAANTAVRIETFMLVVYRPKVVVRSFTKC